MATVKQEVIVQNQRGLHMRQAGEISKLASRYTSVISLSKDGCAPIDAKSILSVMSLAAPFQTKIVILAEGDDAQAAVDALAEMIQRPQES